MSFTRRLRTECPWDQEQTHASLTRHLLEESYETLDALEALARAQEPARSTTSWSLTSRRNSGTCSSKSSFTRSWATRRSCSTSPRSPTRVRDKLTYRHPHVFGDVRVSGSDEVAARWEDLKASEKGRTSVTEGIARQLPALALYTKLLAKSELVGRVTRGPEQARDCGARSARVTFASHESSAS